MNDLIHQYIRIGIIQFGRFQQPDGSFHPLSINFLMLPSYPDLMQQTARQLKPVLAQTHAERLLTTRAAIPLGAVLAVESGIPLTYPYGEEKSYTTAYTIEGAYDVGHPTTLFTYFLTDGSEELALIQTAEAVGLQVEQVICLFKFGNPTALQNRGVPIHTLLDLAAIVEGLTPEPLRLQISAWLQQMS